MNDRLTQMIRMQLELQAGSYEEGDPRRMSGEELADFITWNGWAMEDELHEATAEFKWKPWLTTGRGDWIDRDAFVKELIDAWHFFMNLLLAAAGSYEDAEGKGRPMLEPDEIAAEFFARYVAKNAVNAKRQADGYDGTKTNGRATDEPDIPRHERNTWHVSSEGQLQGVKRAAERAWGNSGEQQHIIYPDGRQEHVPALDTFKETASDDYASSD